jgi:CubicO group peptidase (beta-lactamase class C family)
VFAVGAPPGVRADPSGAFDAVKLERAAERARAAGALGLLVERGGIVEYERYFGGATPGTLLPADFLARPLASVAVGLAHADGRIASLDDKVAKYLTEWSDDSRGAITVRQLLNETSGLERGTDASKVLVSHPFANWSRLPKFATSRGIRLIIGNDYETTALGFRSVHEPEGFFNVSPVNSQLAAIIVQRATGMRFEHWLEQKLLRPAAIAGIELQLDRKSGMAAAHCCVRADGRSAAAIASLLRGADASAILPRGWAAEMRKGSHANPDFGLQLQHLADRSPDVYQLGGAHGGVAWLVPSKALSVVMLAPRDAIPAPAVLDDVLGAVRK